MMVSSELVSVHSMSSSLLRISAYCCYLQLETNSTMMRRFTIATRDMILILVIDSITAVECNNSQRVLFFVIQTIRLGTPRTIE